jgi:hypothetical protein
MNTLPPRVYCSRWAGWFHWFLGAEIIGAIGVYAALRSVIANSPWPAAE